MSAEEWGKTKVVAQTVPTEPAAEYVPVAGDRVDGDDFPVASTDGESGPRGLGR
jgi:hypothetical protein